MDSISWFGERWRAPQVSSCRAGNGWHRFQRRCYRARQAPSPSPCPLSSSTRGEERETERGWRESMLVLPHAMVARVRCVPNEKSGFFGHALPRTDVSRMVSMRCWRRIRQRAGLELSPDGFITRSSQAPTGMMIVVDRQSNGRLRASAAL